MTSVTPRQDDEGGPTEVRLRVYCRYLSCGCPSGGGPELDTICRRQIYCPSQVFGAITPTLDISSRHGFVVTYKLSIQTPSLEIDLQGEDDEVERLYEDIRDEVTERFRRHLEPDSTPSFEEPTPVEVSTDPSRQPSDDQAAGEATVPLHRPDAPAESPSGKMSPETRDVYLKLTVYRPRYAKRYLLAHSELESSALGRALDLEQTRRIHLGADLADRFEHVLERGSTLWRRLTSDARSIVEPEDRDDS